MEHYRKVEGLTGTLESVALDYINNFISASGVAEYYGLNLTDKEAREFLNICLTLRNRNIEERQDHAREI